MEKEGNVVIRSPLPGDLGWIIQVHGQYYAEHFGWFGEFECIVAKIVVDYLGAKDSDRQACFIAEVNGQRVGCIMLMENTDTEGKLRVMFVAEDARGKGIGGLLIESVLKKAKTIGYRTLSLWTTNKQKAARELYKKIGLSLISSTPNITFAKDSYDELWRMTI